MRSIESRIEKLEQKTAPKHQKALLMVVESEADIDPDYDGFVFIGVDLSAYPPQENDGGDSYVIRR